LMKRRSLTWNTKLLQIISKHRTYRTCFKQVHEIVGRQPADSPLKKSCLDPGGTLGEVEYVLRVSFFDDYRWPYED
jgi:hypothetical protein